MTASAKTLRELELAALRWWRANQNYNYGSDTHAWPQVKQMKLVMYDSIARHAAALKRKRTGRS